MTFKLKIKQNIVDQNVYSFKTTTQ